PTWVEDVRAVEVARERRVVDAREDLGAGIAAARDLVRRVLAGNASSARGRIPDHRRVADPRGGVWVVVERSPAGAIRPAAFELLGAADELAGRLGVGVSAIVVEPLPAAIAPWSRELVADEVAAELGRAGADALLVPRGGVAIAPWDFAATVAAAVVSCAPRAVLAPASALGREIVPRLAARLGVGLTGDALGVELSPEGDLLQLKPAFGGQVVAPIRSRTRPEMTTLRPGMMEPIRPDALRAAAAVVEIERVAPPDVLAGRWLAFESEVGEETAALDAAAAVVCVGFGLGKDGVDDARALARVLGGAVGGTRRVCDSAWLPRQAQIGISGRSVAPALYLALGVRGSFNHMVGVGRAGAVVAVNRDPEAEIFAGSDLGIVADAREFCRTLAEVLAQG
ncbi:MAG: electron transfer flavoprotein subunit alpha/FixB family protein, partial [Alphaproteobacteria bacterium]